MMPHLKCYLLSIVLLALSNFAYSQTFEEFKKSRQEDLLKLKLQQEKEIAALGREFDRYVQQADKEFADYLQKEWESFRAFQGIKVPERPKPLRIPENKMAINKLPLREIKVDVSSKTMQQELPEPLLPLVQKTEQPNFLKTSIRIDFYGRPLSFQFDENISRIHLQNINEQAIAQWWTACSKTNYNLLVNQLLDTKNKLSLNDWAYFKLLEKTAAAIAKHETHQARLLTWFLMIRSAYNLKLAFNNNNIYLLIPSANELYGKSYLVIHNQPFYFVDHITSDSFQSYDFDFPGADRLIDFNILQPLHIGSDAFEKQIAFKYNNQQYVIPLRLNINTLYFLKDYPLTELDVYFNAAISEFTKQSLADGIMPIIHKMSKEQAVGFLLSLVQKSFDYKTDQEQFGKEKFFFPEEVFYYPASDCEDRAALFAYLVKQLLHINVIGLEYDGHIATAVQIGDQAYGDYVSFKNTKYTIADPTFINAPLGMTMPKYKNKAAKVIRTRNVNYLTELTKEYWQLAYKWGGQRGSNLQDAIIDSRGNCYLTGYYSKNVNEDKINWQLNTGQRQAFLAKYNKDKKLLWARNIVSDGIATGFSLTLDPSENPVMAGSFSGKIDDGKTILATKNNNEDVFVAAFGKDGQSLWLQKTGLDTSIRSPFFNYVVRLDNQGKKLSARLYFDNEAPVSSGIFYTDHTFTVVGGINRTTGLNQAGLSFNAGDDFSTIEYLKKENDALIANKVSKSIAGLLAVIKLIKANGMVIPGIEAQQALDKYNPGFQSSSPGIYESIGKVNFIKNNEGIIIVQTNNKKAVSFDKIKISNGATIKISSLQSGNEQIDVLWGIEVGKMFVWFDLNFVRVIRDGNLLFDYDSDHTQKTINMKKDILK
jgi:hypothetical protein